MTTPLADLELLIRAHYALIVLETNEPERAEELVRQAASQLNLHYYYWTRSKGVRRGNTVGDPYFQDTQEPTKALKYAEQDSAGVYLFRDLAAYIEDPLVLSHLLDVVNMFEARRGALVVVGTHVKLPDALRPHATFFRLPAPTFDDYRVIVERMIREYSARMRVQVELTPEDRTRLIQNLQGLTLVEAEKIVTRQIVEDGNLRASDIDGVIAAKRQAIQQDGLLEFYPAEFGLNQVAGLKGLKEWLAKRRAVVSDPQRAVDFGLRFPKGILLLGVPGCGKSMCAKAVAAEWGLPLLKLDPANLYDKYVGDSEKNFKRALGVAERMAPVVLWIDELEKAFAQGGDESDGGVSRRVFGSFLNWLQERRGDVFVVATSNDVSRLPPEFIRKGRFDEVFFVDLPQPKVREGIFDIHLARRKQHSSKFDLPTLAGATEGFSGAEIEESVVSALFSAFSAKSPLSTELLLQEIQNTRPLAMTMVEKVSELRAWASARTVKAD
ncbi:MAG TPA: AAA family ATPase [Gemmatimonadaceae bacterium]|nr:AAA family ATPase [Gemmatimonadaceae bacterium]